MLLDFKGYRIVLRRLRAGWDNDIQKRFEILKMKEKVRSRKR